MKKVEADVINNLFDLRASLGSFLDHYDRHTKYNGKTNIIITAKEDYAPQVVLEGPQNEYFVQIMQKMYDDISKDLESMEVFGLRYMSKYLLNNDIFSE